MFSLLVMDYVRKPAQATLWDYVRKPGIPNLLCTQYLVRYTKLTVYTVSSLGLAYFYIVYITLCTLYVAVQPATLCTLYKANRHVTLCTLC